jgi:farnesyl-diphosphate farnesyltransferase
MVLSDEFLWRGLPTMNKSEVESLLIKNSRTFALAISLLPDTLRHEVAITYLILRIADTLEDATQWPTPQRIEELEAFKKLLSTGGDPEIACALGQHWTLKPPCKNSYNLELLASTPLVMNEWRAMTPALRAIICHYSLQEIDGMIHFLLRANEEDEIRLSNLEDLCRYCYVIAGIPGELLTRVFMDSVPSLIPAKDLLWPLAYRFGEGLQLTNIIKDAPQDLAEGRVYIPDGIDQAGLIARARDNLQAAREYVEILKNHQCPDGIIGFCLLPIILAEETLSAITYGSSGTKLTRDQVSAIYHRLQHKGFEEKGIA